MTLSRQPPGLEQGASAAPAATQYQASGGAESSNSLQRRFSPFFSALQRTPLAAWTRPLRRLTASRLQPARHGDLVAWINALETLPELPPATVVLDQPCVGIGGNGPLPPALSTRLQKALEKLHPWRKGPFCLHGVEIDAEWRSDWKWARLADAISPLAGRRVLDVGSGNGYYGYRALGAGADLVLGIDPTPRFVLQFLAVEHLIGAERLAVLPLADDDLPGLCTIAERGFDTVMSMGVLYHRRDPAQHLKRLRRCLRRGGELVLETLVLDRPSSQASNVRSRGAEGPAPRSLVPAGRYAQMRNVHSIPSVAELVHWVDVAGYRDIRLVDLCRTTTDEQRTTPWMRFQSLGDFLDPNDPGLTVEGYPAPVRALLLAQPAE